MEDFAQQNTLRIPDGEIAAIRSDFVSCAVDDEMTLAEIKTHYAKTGGLIDPHTAVGRVAAQALRRDGKLQGRTITLSTAHPAKFPDAVTTATGQDPALTAGWAGLFDKPEYMTRAPADAAAIADIIAARFRA